MYAILAGLGLFIFIIGGICLGFYIWSSIVYMRVLTQECYGTPWLAWIPLARDFAMADVAATYVNEETTVFGYKVPAVLYKLWFILSYGIAVIPVVGSILTFVIRIGFYGDILKQHYKILSGPDSTEDFTSIGYASSIIGIIFLIKASSMMKEKY